MAQIIRQALGVAFWCISFATFAQSPSRGSYEEVRSRFVAAYVAGDAVAMASLYSVEGTLLPSEGDPVILGRQKIETYYRDLFGRSTERRLVPDTGARVTRGPGFVVTAANGWVESVSDGRLDRKPVRASYVYQLQPEGWAIVNSHVSVRNVGP